MIHDFFLPLMALTLLAGCVGNDQREPIRSRGETADIIVVNAKVWTGNLASPLATAFAVRDGRFLYVGDLDGAERFGGPKTQRVDAGGARVIPGMIDAHLHLVSGGMQLARLNLRPVPDRAAFIAAVAERADRSPPSGWILGGRWSTESWPDPTQPGKAWIDSITQDNPVFLTRMDGHSALANSAALGLAGIDRNGPADPRGGRIDRHPDSGEPTGILREAAMDLVSRLIPEDSQEQVAEALAAATREAHRHGITTVHTMSPWSRLAALAEARDAGALQLRVRVFVSVDDWTEYIDRVRGFGNDDRLGVVGFKQFMDGSLGSRTAYMAEPFTDNPPTAPDQPRDSAASAVRSPDWRGLLTEAGAIEGETIRLVKAADAAGLATAIHAIGDQANHLVLDAYQAAAEANGPRPGRRMRIEHAQHLLPGDIARFAKLGVVASMQPFHKADDGRYAAKAIGPQRCKTSYAFRDLLDSGAVLAFGSDWPVVTLNPFRGIHAAVTAETLDGKTFVPEQSITIEEALRAYTLGGAYAAGDQGRLGQIRAGHLADFVIFEQDLLATKPDAIADVEVRATFVGGLQVWPADGPG